MKISDYETEINNGFDVFCNVTIRKHSHLGVMLDFEDFYGEFTLDEMKKVVAKMEELQNEPS